MPVTYTAPERSTVVAVIRAFGSDALVRIEPAQRTGAIKIPSKRHIFSPEQMGRVSLFYTLVEDLIGDVIYHVARRSAVESAIGSPRKLILVAEVFLRAFRCRLRVETTGQPRGEAISGFYPD